MYQAKGSYPWPSVVIFIQINENDSIRNETSVISILEEIEIYVLIRFPV